MLREAITNMSAPFAVVAVATLAAIVGIYAVRRAFNHAAHEAHEQRLAERARTKLIEHKAAD